MYIQTDPRWSNKTLGATPYKIGRWGCTTTSVSSGRQSLAMYPMLDPKELSDRIQYARDGLLIWQSLKNVGLSLVSRDVFWNKDAAQRALKRPDAFCVVEVDGWHWCLLYGMRLGIRLHDPLYGVRFMFPKYKKITKTVIIDRL